MNNRCAFLIPVLLIGLCAGHSAMAAEAPTDTEKELAELRQQITDLARRMAELSSENAEQHKRVMFIERDEAKSHADRARAEARRVHVEIDREHMAEKKPGLGIVMGPSDTGDSVALMDVIDGSPAAKAGLEKGDVLTHVDGKAIKGDAATSVKSVHGLLGDLSVGQKVKLAYLRDGKKAETTATVDTIESLSRVRWISRDGNAPHMTAEGEREIIFAEGDDDVFVSSGPGRMEIRRIARGGAPDSRTAPRMPPAFRFSGLNLVSVDAKLGRYFGTDKGVLVLGEQKALEGLQSGDVLLSLNGKEVNSPRDAMTYIDSQEPKSQLKAQIMRDKKQQNVTVTLGEHRTPDFLSFPPPPAPPAPPKAPKPPKAPTPPPAPAV